MTNRLEILLRRAGRELAHHQEARLFKVPEEMSVTPCDFFGYTAKGQAILVEAKMVARTALPIGSSPGLSKHQWNELLDAYRAGALALIVWANRGVSVCLRVDQVIKLIEGRRSIPWKAIHPSLHRELRPANAVHLLEPWLSPK